MNVFRRRKSIIKKYNLKVVTLSGQVFYYWENPLLAPYRRVLAYFVASHETRLGVQRIDLEKFIELMRKSINEGQFARLGAYLEYFSSYVDLYASEENIFKLANSFILLPGENPLKPETEFSDRKYKLMKADEEIRAFFLQTAWQQITKPKDSENTIDISEYLKRKEVRKAALIFSNLTTQNSSRSSQQK